MLVTETEAKTKWCPMIRISDGSNTLGVGRQDPLCRCIASGCMMWQWDDGHPANAVAGEDFKGCCGLAPDTTYARYPMMRVP